MKTRKTVYGNIKSSIFDKISSNFKNVFGILRSSGGLGAYERIYFLKNSDP